MWILLVIVASLWALSLATLSMHAWRAMPLFFILSLIAAAILVPHYALEPKARVKLREGSILRIKKLLVFWLVGYVSAVGLEASLLLAGAFISARSLQPGMTMEEIHTHIRFFDDEYWNGPQEYSFIWSSDIVIPKPIPFVRLTLVLDKERRLSSWSRHVFFH